MAQKFNQKRRGQCMQALEIKTVLEHKCTCTTKMAQDSSWSFCVMRSVSRKAKQVIDVENLPFYQHWQRTDGEMIGLILHLEKSLSSQSLYTHAHMHGLSLYKEENSQLIKRKYIWTIQCLDKLYQLL
jgi:hypothetical protein